MSATIRSGFVTALYLFDVAEAIDVLAVKRLVGDRATMATLDDKSAGPPRLHYIQPPVVAPGEAFRCRELDGFAVRVKFFDYGVVSLTLTRTFAGDWSDLVALGQTLIENEPLEQHAADACKQVLTVVESALSGRRPTLLDEDYLVFAITAVDPPASAAALVDQHGVDIAQLLRGERQALSVQERDVVLRNALSYLTDDLVVPAWNAAFIYDTEAAAAQAIEILEFANSQLLELRYYDDLLETALTRIYAELRQPRWTDRLAGRRYTRAARELHALFIDVNELTDRSENAVKFVGDIYAARLFGNVAARLGLDRWKNNVEEKLRTLNEIYQSAVQETGMSQGNILELVIVFILVIELGLLLAGITK
jgi:hypothetical protein